MTDSTSSFIAFSPEQNEENKRIPYTVMVKVLHRKMLKEVAEHEQRDIATTLERIIEAHYRSQGLTALLPDNPSIFDSSKDT